MKLFVGTYRKLSRGSMYGKWLDLDEFSCVEDFLLACHRIHRDEKNPVFFFRGCRACYDWELALFREDSAPYEYWEVKAELKKQYFNEDAFSAFVFYCSEFPSVYLVKRCAASYLGEFGSLKNYLKWFYRFELNRSDSLDLEWLTREYEDTGNIACVEGYIFQN